MKKYLELDDNEKKMYEAKKKAHAKKTMALPQEILHNFKKYGFARELWEVLENRLKGMWALKQQKVSTKMKFVVFKYMKNETLENIITRF